jgi:antitoxin component of MazEF toxin-antitoxin module
MPDVTTKQQKVIKVGNSYAVTLDKKLADALQIRDGDPLIARYSERSKVISFAKPSPGVKQVTSQQLSHDEQSTYVLSQVTPELAEWTENFLEENKEAMEKLANL